VNSIRVALLGPLEVETSNGPRRIAGGRLWRGEPLLDAGDAEYALGYRNSWRALRSRTEEDRLAALLGAGLYDDVVADAEALAAAHPLNERVAAALLQGWTVHAGSRRRWWRTRAFGPGCARAPRR
jgi:DNA-binding SARP family transcriptional activator